ncbi:hypothetical protein ACFZB5_33420 [Streptomyces nodosus]|uniref:hypothetical protein n=1 Tax=Streptomyces nodosus TaxID=40318 RepID=UPI0036E2A1F4
MVRDDHPLRPGDVGGGGWLMTEHFDDQATELERLPAADFDAFFAEQAAPRPRQPLTLYGETYTLPDSLPLMFTLQMERVQDSSDLDDVRKMLASLFGADTLDTWAERGMTDRQFRIVLIYASANVNRPGSVSMQRAAELHDEREAEQAGKAPANRAARRSAAKKKGKRGSSGARS